MARHPSLLDLLTDPAVNPFLEIASPVATAQSNEDCQLIEILGGNLHRLTQAELSLMFEAFEYISPTGINRKPCPPDVRDRLRKAASRFTDQSKTAKAS